MAFGVQMHANLVTRQVRPLVKIPANCHGLLSSQMCFNLPPKRSLPVRIRGTGVGCPGFLILLQGFCQRRSGYGSFPPFLRELVEGHRADQQSPYDDVGPGHLESDGYQA